jgi:hypothetical protein
MFQFRLLTSHNHNSQYHSKLKSNSKSEAPVEEHNTFCHSLNIFGVDRSCISAAVGLGILLAADKPHPELELDILPVEVGIPHVVVHILLVAADTLPVVAGILVAVDIHFLAVVGILHAVGTLLVVALLVVVVHRRSVRWGVDCTHYKIVHNWAVRSQFAHSSAGKNNPDFGNRRLDYSWQADEIEEGHQFVQPSRPSHRRMDRSHLALISRTTTKVVS